MFVQTVHNKKHNLGPETGPVFYWQKHGSIWVGLNEYGEPISGYTKDSDHICNWLDDETAEIVKNPVFKQRILWPRVFIEPMAKYFYFEDGSKFYLEGNSLRVKMSINHITDCLRGCYKAKEVFGKERQQYVDALNTLGIKTVSANQS